MEERKKRWVRERREWGGYGGGEEREEKGGRCGWYTSKKEVTL